MNFLSSGWYLVMKQFFSGLWASLHVAPVLSALARSKKSRREMSNVIALNCSLILVDIFVSFQAPQLIARTIFMYIPGRRDLSSLQYPAVIDAIATAILFACSVLPLLVSSLMCTSRWSYKILSAAFPKARHSPIVNSARVQSSSDFLSLLGESAFQAVLIVVMTLQASLIDSFPFIGRILAIGITAAVTGFAAMDAGRWSRHEVPVFARLAALESDWAWYAGFGTIVALASYFCSPGINVGIYGLLSVPLTLIAAGLKGESAPSPQLSETSSNQLSLLLPFKWSVIQLMRLLNWGTSRYISTLSRRRQGNSTTSKSERS